MQEDFYQTLGVMRNASADEIHKAYRDLARRYHPDLNQDDVSAKQNFQAVQRAYEVLSDTKKREMYNRYGKDFEAVQEGAAHGPWTRGAPGGGFNADDIDFSQIFGEQHGEPGAGGFADMFRNFTQGAGTRRQAPPRPTTGASLRHDLDVPFVTAILGGEAQLTVQRSVGKTEHITVKIPPGVENDNKIRLRGQGEAGRNGGPPGDILIRVRVGKHRWYSRNGDDLEVKVPIKLSEAIIGATVEVPTPHGTVSIKIPPGTSSGRRLRVKGQGVSKGDDERGDLYAQVEIEVPTDISDEARRWVQELDARMPDPRADLKW